MSEGIRRVDQHDIQISLQAQVLESVGAWFLFLPTLLPRSQPDRDGFLQAQNPNPEADRAKL